MGLFKKIAKIAKNVIDDPWQTIGTVAGAALGGPLGAALGNVAGGVASQGPGNYVDNIGPNLFSAGLSAAGTYGAGQLGDLLSGTSLGSDVNSLTNSIGLGDAFSPEAGAARTAVSTASTSPASSTSFLSGYLPGGAGGGTGGGGSGGFFSDLLGGGGAADTVGGSGLPVGKAVDITGRPWLGDVLGGGAAPNPLANYSAIGLTNGDSSVLPSGLAKNVIKTALPYALQRNNDSGYEQLQGAARQAAANSQPFLDSGTAAAKKLSDFYGLNGADAASAAMAGLEDLPGFQFARDQGIKSLDASAASKGMLRSGNQEQAVQGYGTGLAMQYVQQYLDNLARQQAAGMTAADDVSNADLIAASQFANQKQAKIDPYNQALGLFSSFL